MIDRQIRSLIEYELVHRKVSNYGLIGKILSMISIGNLFVSVKIWYPMKEKVGSQFFKAHKNTIVYMIHITYLQRLVEWVGHGVPTMMPGVAIC